MCSYFENLKKLFLLIFVILILSCEDVVDVSVPSEEEPRLIVDALVRIDPDTTIANFRAKVNLTNSFFEEIPVANLKQITMGGAILVDNNNPGSGVYERQRSISNLEEGETLILQIDWEDKLYFGRTTYVPTVPIDKVEIGRNTLFDEDETEVIVTFTDNPDRDDFYVFDFGFGNFATVEDQFIQGQQFSFSYFYDQKFEPGQELAISILGADQSFYNYMNLLIEQTDNNLGVFDTPRSTIRGNIFDVTKLDNIEFFDNVNIPEEFALGYFAIVQEYVQTITVE